MTLCSPMGDLSSIPAIQWGRHHETTAAEQYTELIKRQHLDTSVSKTGLWLCKCYPFIGASPDAIVSCKCCGIGVVETKCPYKHRTNDIKAILDDKSGCLEFGIEKQTVVLKKSHSYYTQIQTQMFVCDLMFSDFVLWTTKVMI